LQWSLCWQQGCGSHGMYASYISMEVRIYSSGFTVKPQSNMWRSGEEVRSWCPRSPVWTPLCAQFFLEGFTWRMAGDVALGWPMRLRRPGVIWQG
jgi:hypothetical protein